MIKPETIESIRREVYAMPESQLIHKQDLMTRYCWMNSPCDNVELKLINERLKAIQ